MAVAEFRAALDVLDAERASGTPDGDKVVTALSALKDHRSPHPTRADLSRMLAACDWALDYFAEARAANPPAPGWRAYWICVGLIENTFTDEGTRHRSFAEKDTARHLAFGMMHGERPPKPATPKPHVPLDVDEATALAVPYLAWLEKSIAKAQYSHLELAWNVARRPVAPFDVVFENWLADLDARGLGTGNSLPALQVAQALEQIACEGRQVLAWQTCVDEIFPKMEDPHPMVAGCAGKLMGSMYACGADRFGKTTPWPLTQMLEHLTQVAPCRRAVAGGFIAGFEELQYLIEDAGEGFDLDAWVMAILAHPLDEPYVPGAQAFWFYVHEHYWRDVDFMMRLLDAGHDWIAYMCATEGAELDLVRPVLDRIAGADDSDLAAAARAFIAQKAASA